MEIIRRAESSRPTKKLFSARKPAGYCASENQEKFLGLFENSPKVYVIHREGIFGQNAKIKFHKFACKFIPYYFNLKNNVPIYDIDTFIFLFIPFLRGPGNFNDFPTLFLL